MIGVELVTGRLPDARIAWRTGRRPMLLFLVTLVLTLTVPLQWGILGGAVLSLIAYVASSSKGGALKVYRRDDEGWILSDDVPATVPVGEVTVLRLTGSNFFAETPSLVDEAPGLPPPGSGSGVLVLDVGDRQSVSSTSLKAMQNYHDNLVAAGHALVLTGVSEQLRQTLERTGLLEVLGPDNVLTDDPHLGRNRDAGIRRGQELLAT